MKIALAVAVWFLISIPAGVLLGRMMRGPKEEPLTEAEVALQAGLEELELYANTKDPFFAESARSLFYLAGFSLANDLEIEGEVQR